MSAGAADTPLRGSSTSTATPNPTDLLQTLADCWKAQSTASMTDANRCTRACFRQRRNNDVGHLVNAETSAIFPSPQPSQ